MDLSLHAFLIAAGIFCLRILDVSVGTVRVMFTVRGERLVSALLGVVESFIWIFAISRAMKFVDNPLSMIAWATGFATGTVVGITIEQWIASGTILVRVISRSHAIRLKELLHSEGFGVTAIQGQGRETTVLVIFVVAPRRRSNELLGHIQRIDPDAFITIEPVAQAIGGYPSSVVVPDPASMKK